MKCQQYLGNRNYTAVNTQGHLRYFEIRRIIVASAVIEFFDDNGEIGILIFGGGQHIQKELIPILQSRYRLSQIRQKRLKPDEIRQLFTQYYRRLKKIQIDPSNDIEWWGRTKEAKLLTARRQYFHVESEMLTNIRNNDRIMIQGIKTDEDEVFVDGMLRPTRVRFEVTSSSIKISVTNFEVRSEAAEKAQRIFFDLARSVYFSIMDRIQGGSWEDHEVIGTPEMIQLTLQLDEQDSLEDRDAAR